MAQKSMDLNRNKAKDFQERDEGIRVDAPSRSGGEFFANVAQEIAHHIRSKTVLVIDRKSGLLANELKKRALDVSTANFGEDAGSGTPTIAIEQAPNPITTRYDVVVIAHLSDLATGKIGPATIAHLCSAAPLVLACAMPGDLTDGLPQSALMHMPWLSEFAKHGFGRKKFYENNFISAYFVSLARIDEEISEHDLENHAILISDRLNISEKFFRIEHEYKEKIALIMEQNDHRVFEIHETYHRQITQLQKEITESVEAQTRANTLLQEMRHSTSWRITAPYRIMGQQVIRVRRGLRVVRELASSRGGYMALARAAIRVINRDGLRGAITTLRSAGMRSARGELAFPRWDYAAWLNTYATLDDKIRQEIRDQITLWRDKPLISIVMPVYNPEVSWLEEAIESVRRQIYTHWELCVADDGSTKQGVKELLDTYAAKDKRIKVVYRPVNGHISEASNSAIEIATGVWMALLDQDDLLTEDALYYVARELTQNTQLEMIYSDEDKIEDDRRFDPYFKPDWNIDLLRSHNMACHLSIFRLERIRELGGFRKGFEGAQDYDLVLRFAETLPKERIGHIPRVLYHWRCHSNSTAQTSNNKSYAAVAGQKALSEHLERLGINGNVEVLETGMYRVRYSLPEVAPLVSLIVPTRNGLNLIRQCITSILEKTTYPSYEIIIVDNNSDDPETLEYFREIQSDPRVRVERDERPFNYSALNNRAVGLAAGEYIGLINNDIEVITPDWLSEMMSLAIQDDVGAVGAKLWYPDDTLQHGGVIIGLGGVAGHSHKMLGRDLPGYFRRAELPQSLSAVTAACLVIKKAIYRQVGGLNEHDLTIAFNDVDFCLKVREAGYRNVWTPYAELYHHESASRGVEDTPEKIERFANEISYMQTRWKTHLLPDPSYSPNLTLNYEDFSLAWPPRNQQDPTLAS